MSPDPSIVSATGGTRVTNGLTAGAYLANLVVETFEKNHEASKNVRNEAKENAIHQAENACNDICEKLTCRAWTRSCMGKVTTVSMDEGQPLSASQAGPNLSNGTGQHSDPLGWLIWAKVIYKYKCSCECQKNFFANVLEGFAQMAGGPGPGR